MTSRSPFDERSDAPPAKAGSSETQRYWDRLADSAGQAAAIDPRDRRGYKNAYISLVRDMALHDALASVEEGGVVLDFGCGTGTFLSTLLDVRSELLCAGLDISRSMLEIGCGRDPRLRGRTIHCDGQALPFVDGCLAGITSAGSLLYLIDRARLEAVAREFWRVLKPGGILAFVEQVRRTDRIDRANHKRQRRPSDLISCFEFAGFRLQEWRQVRRGRFPLLYAIRYGLVGTQHFRGIAAWEARVRRKSRMPCFDYADALFRFSKPLGNL